MPKPGVVPRMRSGAIRKLQEAAESIGAEELALELVAEARAAVRATPQDAQALEELVRCHLRLSALRGDLTDEGFGPKGRADRRQAAEVWERFLALDPPAPDAEVAFRMANVFDDRNLNDPARECQAMELALAHTDTPTAGRYERLARLYDRLGRLDESAAAAARAVELMPRLMRGWMRRQMRDLGDS